MATTAQYRLADKILDGQLGDMLTAWRGSGYSYATIAKKLQSLGIDCTGETVRRWWAALEGERQGAAS